MLQSMVWIVGHGLATEQQWDRIPEAVMMTVANTSLCAKHWADHFYTVVSTNLQEGTMSSE